MDELSRQLVAAHAAGAWGKVIDLWRQLARSGVAEPSLAERAAEAFFRHGLNLGRRGNPEEALRQLHAAVELQPGESRYRYHLALAQHRSQNWQAALCGYEEVLRREPTHERAAYHLCLACLQAGRECEAGGAFDRAFRVLSGQRHEATEPLPWALRRLQAWRAFVLTGSAGELASLFNAPPATGEAVPPGAKPALDLEAALVTLAVGKAEAAVRWLEATAGSEIPALAACAAAIRVTLAARSGHHRKAAQLATLLPTDDDILDTAPAAGLSRQVSRAVRVRALWEAGLALWWRGDRTDAIPHWQRAHSLAPECTELLHNLALALEAAGLPLAGDLWYDVARAWERRWKGQGKGERPDFALTAGLAYQRAGKAFLARGNWKEARRLLKQAEALAPGDRDVLLDLAHLAVMEKDLAWFQSNLQRLTGAVWNDAPRLTNLGHLCLELKLDEGAEPMWRRLLELEPEHECAGEHLAAVYADRGERAWARGGIEDALGHFERGLELVPEAGRLHVWAGGIYLTQGDRKRAAAAFGRAASGRDDPKAIAYAEVEVGKRLLVAGLSRDARAAFDRGLRADSSADTYLGIGLAYLTAGSMDEAVECFKRAGRRSGQDPDVVTTAMDALIQRKQYAAALELVLAALELHPDAHVLWMFRTIAEFSLAGPQMDSAVARRARTLALRAGDREALRLLDEVLSLM